jgi:hypothetical protein
MILRGKLLKNGANWIMTSEIEYKYHEDKILEELKEYIDSTYQQHYVVNSDDNIQVGDLIFNSQHGTGFCVGSILKYASRYGKKGGYNKDDLFKIIHYAMFTLYINHRDDLTNSAETLSDEMEAVICKLSTPDSYDYLPDKVREETNKTFGQKIVPSNAQVTY